VKRVSSIVPYVVSSTNSSRKGLSPAYGGLEPFSDGF
jgi:hypothetical protein